MQSISKPAINSALGIGKAITALFGAALFSAQPLAAPSQYEQAVNADAPLLYYRLSETTGNTVNHGSLGAGYDGVFNGNMLRGLVTAGGDTGVRFTAAADFIESLSVAPASLTGNPDFSVETIIRIPADGFSTQYPTFLHWGAAGTGNSVYFSLRHHDLTRIYAGYYNAGLMTTDLMCVDRWLHIVWTRDSSAGANDSETGTTLYINGVPMTLVRDPVLNPGFDASLTVTSTTFRINRATDLTRWSTIEMDEVALYDRVLDESEVLEHWSAFTDNTQGDVDGDSVLDTNDNCLLTANPGQRDTDADQFGNFCDADLDNNLTVNAIDLGIFKSVFFTPDANSDFNGDGIVNTIDLGLMRTRFFLAPGPSGTRFICTP